MVLGWDFLFQAFFCGYCGFSFLELAEEWFLGGDLYLGLLVLGKGSWKEEFLLFPKLFGRLLVSSLVQFLAGVLVGVLAGVLVGVLVGGHLEVQLGVRLHGLSRNHFHMHRILYQPFLVPVS